MNNHILKINNLNIRYGDNENAVNDFSLTIDKGKIICIVGESGSGKSTLIHSILGLMPSNAKILSGEIIYKGINLEKINSKDFRKIRGKDIAMIFQNTQTHMDPIKKISKQYHEFLKTHNKTITKKESIQIQSKMLKLVGLDNVDQIMNSFISELSGGMQQRVAIAMAFTFKPSLILADEPTSALDTIVQAQIVKEMLELKIYSGTSILFVTHDMGIASYISDYIAVMKNGNLVEFGSRDDIIHNPKHDYTKKLLDSTPKFGDDRFAKKF